MRQILTPELAQKYTPYQLDKIINHIEVTASCPVCSSSFDAKSYIFRPTAIYPRINEFCSPLCKKFGAGHKNKVVFRSYKCEHCNNTFVPRKSKVHQTFCNRACYAASRTGVPNPNIHKWIHKITPPKGSISKCEIAWLSLFDITHTQYLIRVEGTCFRVDGYNASTNTIYEYLGSFWHGNPDKYPPADVHPICKCTYGELYDRTIGRIELLRAAGYSVIYVWG